MNLYGPNGKKVPPRYKLGSDELEIKGDPGMLKAGFYQELFQCSACEIVGAIPARQNELEIPNLPKACPNCHKSGTLVVGDKIARRPNPVNMALYTWIHASKSEGAWRRRAEMLERRVEKLEDKLREALEAESETG